MGNGRLEAFSDVVLAIVITIMVLELKVPHEPTVVGLAPLWPIFLSYVLSFIYVGIYWTNHHHLMHAVHSISGRVLWANLHLLFWLSLIPFVTAWMGENHFATIPVAAYGVALFLAALAYWLLVRKLIGHHEDNRELGEAIETDLKGWVSMGLYVPGIGLSFVNPWAGFITYAIVALVWSVPDRRIEKHLARTHSGA